MEKKHKLPKLDLSKYNSSDQLPANIIAIIRNALIFYEGNTKKVAKFYSINREKIDEILSEYYLNITQIIDAKTKSKELDDGVETAIKLMSSHIQELQKNKTSNLLRSDAVNQVTKMTDRLMGLKANYNNTFDTLVNRTNEYAIKVRQMNLAENGKPEDSTEYNQNQNIVLEMLKEYVPTKERLITVVNIKTGEIRTFERIVDAEKYIGTIGHLRDIARQKSAYKGTYLIRIDE